MEETNSLSNYAGRELKPAIKTVQVVQGKTKDGGTYYSVDIIFINGYRKKIFLNEAERFAVINAIDLVDTQKQIEF